MCTNAIFVQVFSYEMSKSFFNYLNWNVCHSAEVFVWLKWGGSPDPVVMGGDSWSEVHGFESQHQYWMDFFTNIVKLKCLFEKTKINKNEAGVGPSFKKNTDNQVWWSWNFEALNQLGLRNKNPLQIFLSFSANFRETLFPEIYHSLKRKEIYSRLKKAKMFLNVNNEKMWKFHLPREV